MCTGNLLITKFKQINTNNHKKTAHDYIGKKTYKIVSTPNTPKKMLNTHMNNTFKRCFPRGGCNFP